VPIYREQSVSAVVGLPEPEVAEAEGGFLCPRRGEVGGAGVFKFPTSDRWRGDDNTCSYCGSLNQDWLMDRLEAGTIELGPTDKNYKVYVENAGGEPFNVHGAPKFYFPHLSKAQRQRFVEMLNEKKIKIGAPGHFYVLPFFVKR
jgi:hypothetical protein